MTSDASAPERDRRTVAKWIDVGAALTLAVIAGAIGATVQTWWDAPWDPDGPPAASEASREALATAQLRAREFALTRDEFQKQAVAEQATRVKAAARLTGATGKKAGTLMDGVRESDLIIDRLRLRATEASQAAVAADHEVAKAADEVTKSRIKAERRANGITAADRLLYGLLAWAVLVAVLLFVARKVVHRRTLVLGGLSVLLLVWAVTNTGWAVAAGIAVLLLALWIFRPVSDA